MNDTPRNHAVHPAIAPPSDSMLDRYAYVIVADALNLQRGQNLLIRSEPYHEPFVQRVVETARNLGAGEILTYFYDREAEIERMQRESIEELSAIHPELQRQGDWITATRGGSIYIAGPTDPHCFDNVDPVKLNALEKAKKHSLKNFFDALMLGKLQWTLACAATPLWAQKVYPDARPEEAEAVLWETLLRVSAIDQEDPVGYWRNYSTLLEKRARFMNSKKFARLHIRNPGTDLTVGLSPLSHWEACGSSTDQGVPYYANRPSFEIFTAPDRRVTQGQVALTLPAEFNKSTIEGATFRFEHGQVVDFEATNGQALLKTFLSSDEGASYLGEIALVGMDNPLSQEGRIFYETLLDENCRCHFAFGRAYGTTVDGFAGLNQAQLVDIGYNSSDAHQDVMISDENTDIDAISATGERTAIIRNGLFVIDDA